MGGLLDMAAKLVKDVYGDQNGFATEITFTPPEGDAVTVNGLAIKHYLSSAPTANGMSVISNSKTARVSVSEAALRAVSYPVRDAAGEVNMQYHRVAFKDKGTQVVCEYVITDHLPDETVGMIVFMLSDYLG